MKQRVLLFCGHGAFILLVLFLILGTPLLSSDVFAAWMNDTDAVSSATNVIEAPSGEFVVLINRERHEKSGTLETWRTFFSGGDIGVVFEDLDCIVIRGDEAGLDAAESYRLRLPENQMRVRSEDGVLALSKAEYGRYDIMIMSAEAASSFGAETLEHDHNTLYLRVS